MSALSFTRALPVPTPKSLVQTALSLLVLAAAKPAAAQTQVFADEFNGTSLNTSTWKVFGPDEELQRTQWGLKPTFGADADGTKFVKIPLQSYNPNPGKTGSYFQGSQIFTNQEFQLGQGMEFEARIRSKSLPSGLVLGYFTLGNRGEWQSTYQKTEIDYELLTKQGTNKLWLNIWDDWNPLRGGPNAGTLNTVSGLNWNGGAWNTFVIRWLPNGRTEWVVNGKLVRAESTVQPGAPQRVCLNLWAAASGWTTAYDSGLLPSSSSAQNKTWSFDVDYVRVRKLTTTSQGSLGTGTGLTANYYNSPNLSGTLVTQIDPRVNFNWGEYRPSPGIGSDAFSVRWSGYIQPQFSQTYTFAARTDDGVRLWVNNKQLINNWVNQGATEKSATIALTAGQKYPVKMEYYDNTGSALAQLFWSSPSTPKQLVPQSQLYPETPPSPPTFSPNGGTFTTVQSVRITSSTSGASIRYTLNGSTPSLNSASLANGGTLNISSTSTVKAIAYLPTTGISTVKSATYTINLPADTTPPLITVSSPINNSAATSLPAFRGTAVDNTGGSGLNRVELVLRRASDNLRWDGSSWVTTDWGLSCSLSGSTWTGNGLMPSGSNLADGLYYAKAVAFDNRGNANAAEVAFKLDRTGPTVRISTPANNASLTSLTSITGTSTDAVSGIRNIDVVVQRRSDNRVWNGWEWLNSNTAIPSKLSGSNWSAASPLSNGGSMPSGGNLPGGAYQITAVAYDNAGNVSVTSITVNVTAAALRDKVEDPSARTF